MTAGRSRGLASERARSPTRARSTRVAGWLCVLGGVAWLCPIAFSLLERGHLSETAGTLVWIGPALVAGGVIALARARRRQQPPLRTPAPVRAAIMAGVAFVAFCVLELSDGLVRQGGRVFYWTTVLLLPALGLLWGITSARPWAWRTTRVLAASFALWFVGVSLAIPFADVRSDGEPVPPLGRLYMIVVSLAFASVGVYVFRALGSPAARAWFQRSRFTSPPMDGGRR